MRNPQWLEEEGGSQVRGERSEKTLERLGGAGYEGLTNNRGPRKAFNRLGAPGPISLKTKD